MNKSLKKLEIVIDKIIPILLIILIFVIIGELLFKEQIHKYSLYIDMFDAFLIITFGTDLAFKYHRIRKLKTFIRKYWIEILAIFPFFLIFRLYEEIALLFGGLREFILPSQQVLHEGVEVQKFVREESRTTKLLRPILRLFRFGELKEKKERKQFFKDLSRIEDEGVLIAKDSIKLTEQGVKTSEKIAKRLEKHGILVTKEGFKFLKDFEQKLEKESRKLMNPKRSRIRKVAKHIKSKRLVNASLFYEKP